MRRLIRTVMAVAVVVLVADICVNALRPDNNAAPPKGVGTTPVTNPYGVIDPPHLQKQLTYIGVCPGVTSLGFQPSKHQLAVTKQGHPQWLIDEINTLVGPKSAGDSITIKPYHGEGRADRYRTDVYDQIELLNLGRDINSPTAWAFIQVPNRCEQIPVHQLVGSSYDSN